MLARTNIIRHPSGITLKTPLLIPSFSSKGFGFSKSGEESEAKYLLELTKEFLERYMLISAYDLYYKFIPPPEDFIGTEIIIVDSGGYETSNDFDLSSDKKIHPTIKDWSLEKLTEIYDNWNGDRFPAVFVNYDHFTDRKNLEKQIVDAHDLLDKYPKQLSNFLIKTESDSQRFIKVSDVVSRIDEISSFDIIGFTEKELGNSLYKRMQSICDIRTALDNKGLKNPLHIFGSLDPISSLLYFICGAEIFDGLTWLRYAYVDGNTIYQSTSGIVSGEIDIHTAENKVRASIITKNSYYLTKLHAQMVNFAHDKNYAHFGPLETLIKNTVTSFFNYYNSK